MFPVKAALKLTFHATVLLTLAAPFFLMWSIWRIISGILVLPPRLYQNGDDLIFQMYQRVIIIIVEEIVGCKVFFHGDIDNIVHKKERAIYLVNYQSRFDWFVVNSLAERTGCLGNVRYIVKQALQSVPLYGFYFYQHGCVYVNKEHFNEPRMKKMLSYLADKTIASHVVLFPEGYPYSPFHTTAIKKSNDYANSKGLAPMRQCLMPRVKIVRSTVQALRDNMDAIYNVTLIYGDTRTSPPGRKPAPSVCEAFAGECREVHIHVTRIPIEDVPNTDAALKRFVLDVFYAKDALLTSYYSLEPDEDPPELGRGEQILCDGTRNQISFTLAVLLQCTFLLTQVGLGLLWKTWVFGSIFGYSWLGMNYMA